MPTGPKGEKRAADVIGAAITVAKIATGEIEEARIRPQSSLGARAAGHGFSERLGVDVRGSSGGACRPV